MRSTANRNWKVQGMALQEVYLPGFPVQIYCNREVIVSTTPAPFSSPRSSMPPFLTGRQS